MSKLYINDKFHTLKDMNIHNEEDVNSLISQGEFVVKGGNVEVCRLQLTNFRCFIKKYINKGDYRYIGRTSSAFGEKRSYEQFSQLGIPHPEVLICAEKRLNGKLYWSILATREIANSVDLVYFFAHKRNQSQRTTIIKSIAQFVGKMHCNKFFHGSLRLRNILITDDLQIYFIDCPKGGKKKTPFGRSFTYDILSIYKDIARVCSEEESMLFLRSYCQTTNNDIQKWQRQIPKLCAKKFGKMKPLVPMGVNTLK